MTAKFTIETATDEQWLDVLDYIFETEPSQLEVLADNANYNAFLDDGDIYYALEAGVDNWNWFAESIEESMHELFTTTRPSALNNATNGIVFLAKTVLEYSANWHNYVARKCEEYQDKN